MARVTKDEARAQELAAGLMRVGLCGDQSGLWLVQEAAHAAATTRAEALAAAEPLLQLCAVCPVLQSCAAWARADRYTGVAAGMAWRDGRVVPVDFVPYRQRRGKRKTGVLAGEEDRRAG